MDVSQSMSEPSSIPATDDQPTIEECSTQARARCGTIFTNQEKLQKLISVHWETIERRWHGKSRPKRKEMLRSVWPGIPQEHRPDYHAIIRRITTNQTDSTHPGVFKWPTINLDDLQMDSCLLQLLLTRTHNPPQAFAESDHDDCELGRVTGRINILSIDGYSIHLTSQKTSENYGMIVKDDELESRQQKIFAFTLGEGLIVLEIQSWIMCFLFKCCIRILHDKSNELEQLLKSEAQSLPKILRLPQKPDKDSPLLSMAIEGQYRCPSDVPFGRMSLMIEAVKSTAEEHLWDMMSDPGHFGKVLTDTAQHHPLTMYEAFTRFKLDSNDWGMLVWAEIDFAATRFIIWNSILEQTLLLEKSFDHNPVCFSPKTELSETAQDGLMYIFFLFDEVIETLAERLRILIPASLPFRQSSIKEFKSFIMNPGARPVPARRKFDALDVSLQLLLAKAKDGEDINEFIPTPPGQVVETILHIFKQDASLKNKFTPLIDSIFQEHALATIVYAQIKKFIHPWIGQLIKKVDKGHATWKLKARIDIPGLKRIRATPSAQVAGALGDLVKNISNFDYPSDKSYSEANTNTMRKAEQQLDRVW